MNHIEPIPGLVCCSLTVPNTNSGQGHKLFYCMGPESPVPGKKCQLIVVSLSLQEIPDSYSMLASLNATCTLVGPCPLPLFLAVGPCPHFKSMSDHVPTLASDYVVSDHVLQADPEAMSFRHCRRMWTVPRKGDVRSREKGYIFPMLNQGVKQYEFHI